MKDLKEKLKGTCVLNESVEMGAEIVKLYTEAGIGNECLHSGRPIGVYFGEKDGEIFASISMSDFDKVLTLDQLREIVRGEKQTSLNNILCCEKELDEAKEFSVINKSPFSESVNFDNYNEVMSKELSTPVEFKEGEMVEAWAECFNEHFWELVTFTGGKTKKGEFICENNFGELITYKKIRVPDLDEPLRDIFDEVIKDATLYNPHELIGNYYEESEVKQICIEAMKRVKK